MTDEARKRAADVYDLVKDLSGRIDQMAELREQVGGETEIMARVAEHEQLMIVVPEIQESQERTEATVNVLADKMIGEKISDPLHPGEFMINGRGEYLRKPHPKWPQWAGRFVIEVFSVATALLIFLAATA